MYINLQKHHTAYLIPIIEARLEVLKKRLIKKFGKDWWDLNEDGLHNKMCQRSQEYHRLSQTLRIIYDAR